MGDAESIREWDYMGTGFSSIGVYISRLDAAVCAISALSLIAAIISALCSPAMAGTETGEFCPTCPDWTNLEGWLAQKASYEKTQQTGPYAGTTNKNNKISNVKNNINSEKPLESYPEQSIITFADASLKGLVALDVRSSEDFERGHIPGARNIYWRSIESDDALDPALAEDALCMAGINNTDRILICGGDDEGASFMFWALNYLGHKSLSRFDGDANAVWLAGIKAEKNSPPVRRSNYTIHRVPGVLVNESSLQGLLKLGNIQILDARDFTDYGRSKLTDYSLPFQADKLYGDDRKIMDAAALNDLLGRRGLNKDNLLLVYGTPKAYDLFYCLRLMGYNVTLLEGDWWQETKWAVSNVKESQ